MRFGRQVRDREGGEQGGSRAALGRGWAVLGEQRSLSRPGSALALAAINRSLEAAEWRFKEPPTFCFAPCFRLRCAFLFCRNPFSGRGQIPKIFNREELLRLSAGTEELQRLLQRHPQGLDRRFAGRVRERPLWHRGEWGCPWSAALGRAVALLPRPLFNLSPVCVKVFGKPEYLKYQDALNELANV